jgi:hypothetical protein
MSKCLMQHRLIVHSEQSERNYSFLSQRGLSVNRNYSRFTRNYLFVRHSNILWCHGTKKHQLPNGQQSQYTDKTFIAGGDQFNPTLVAQQAQDPSNPAHPKHPKVSSRVEECLHSLLIEKRSITSGPRIWRTNSAMQQFTELERLLEQTL